MSLAWNVSAVRLVSHVCSGCPGARRANPLRVRQQCRAVMVPPPGWVWLLPGGLLARADEGLQHGDAAAAASASLDLEFLTERPGEADAQHRVPRWPARAARRADPPARD